MSVLPGSLCRVHVVLDVFDVAAALEEEHAQTFLGELLGGPASGNSGPNYDRIVFRLLHQVLAVDWYYVERGFVSAGADVDRRPSNMVAGAGSPLGCRLERSSVAGASAHGRHCLPRWRIHVIVHPDHHRNEYQHVVDEVQLDPRNPDLADACRHGATKPESLRLRLIKQNKMLDMMPELDPEGHHPPRVRGAGKSLPDHPQAYQHHQSESVVEHFRFHEPGIV